MNKIVKNHNDNGINGNKKSTRPPSGAQTNPGRVLCA